MAAAFPITIKAVEALTQSRSRYENKNFGFATVQIRGLSVLQVVAFSYILFIQLYQYATSGFGPNFLALIGCEKWLNICYTTGLFTGVFINFHPTSNGIASYIGLEGLVAFVAFHKFFLDAINTGINPVYLQGAIPSDYSKSVQFLWTTVAVSNVLVLITALLMLLKYICYWCECKPSEESYQDV